ncbi:hypothetical protein PsYK624_023800 [Phanerochaete sordida]|uniref:Uncharacterized protein n=1 Tax=Phanerochaete sordida TaxID=48140 RepID=A0A9P3G1Q0_9APHY|nr:hypothetical protein PsYK624_023800 [Phanerochaete sordida]
MHIALKSSQSDVASAESSQKDAYSHLGDAFSEPAEIPAPSSTVLPSSPAKHTPPSVLKLSPSDAQAPVMDALQVAAYSEPEAPLPKSHIGQTNDTSVDSGRELSETQSSHGSSCVSCQEMRHPSHSYYPMDTTEAQQRFIHHLDKLLLRVWTRQQSGSSSQSRTASLSSGSCPSSATSSLYAADISLAPSSGDSVVSSISSSSSRSSSSAVSSTASLADIDDTSAYTQDTDGFLSSTTLEYDIQTPIRFSMDLIYGSVSDEDDGDTVVDVDFKEDSPSLQLDTHATSLAADRPGTPFPNLDLKTPAAPRKTKCHFYPPATEGQPVQPPRKRLRTNGSDQLDQDLLQTGECIRIEAHTADSSADTTAYTQRNSSSASDVPMSTSTLLSEDPPPQEETTTSSAEVSTSLLAREPASFRRAASLRSEPSASDVLLADADNATRLTKSSPAPAHTSGAPHLATYPRTQPASPISKIPAADQPSLLSPVPVLSPSAFSPVPRGRFSAIAAAEDRIQALVLRELAGRNSDGLLEGAFSGISEGPVQPEDSVMQEEQTAAPESDEEDAVPLILGIEEDFRIKAVEWILDVMPPAKVAKKNAFVHLRAQLTESPDTRWHAAHLFTRYFLEIGTSTPPSPLLRPLQVEEGPRVLQGREAVTWDIALACLSLAVKFHRDFLHPLYPVVATDYLAISPHTIQYEDLEAAHRDVLSALDFCIGSSTPGAYIEELLVALPSLRSFVDGRGNWDYAHAEAWEILFDTLVDVNYLRYPACAIAGCALILGIVESIVFKRKTEAAVRAKFAPESALKRKRGLKCECDRLRLKASKAVKGVEEDVREVLGVSKVTWAKCMKWLKALEG